MPAVASDASCAALSIDVISFTNFKYEVLQAVLCAQDKE
jgi:hypothetical protein